MHVTGYGRSSTTPGASSASTSHNRRGQHRLGHGVDSTIVWTHHHAVGAQTVLPPAPTSNRAEAAERRVETTWQPLLARLVEVVQEMSSGPLAADPRCSQIERGRWLLRPVSDHQRCPVGGGMRQCWRTHPADRPGQAAKGARQPPPTRPIAIAFAARSTGSSIPGPWPRR
jgi:hypothetical protein